MLLRKLCAHQILSCLGGEKLLKDERAQTTIEYLLIIGGAVASATLVGLYLKQAARSVSSEVEKQAK